MSVRTTAGLPETAKRAVNALNEGKDPGRLPVYEPRWNAAFVGAIRAFKDQFRGSRDLERSLRILGELLYGKDIHWALELLQNAEDAGARRIAFIFYPDRVVVINDGTPFDPGDVWGICSAGHSGKKNKVGFFGIGFKAVYKLTDLPEVHSGPYSFAIEGKIYPQPLTASRTQKSGARFVLPIRQGEQTGLAAMMRHIATPAFLHVLLTLRNVREIRIVDRLGAGVSGRFSSRVSSPSSRSAGQDVELAASWSGIEAEQWRRYEFESEPLIVDTPREGRSFEAGETTQIVVARRHGGPTTDARLHCFLPLDVRSELRWLVQADFEPTPGRERLRQGVWNRWLMRQIGRALAGAVTAEARLGVPPWDLVPLDSEVVDEDQRIAYESVMSELRDREFVRTARGFRKPSAVAWEEFSLVRSAVREDDLARIGLPAASYASQSVLGPIAADRASRAEQVLDALGARAIGCSDLVALLALADRRFYAAARDSEWWMAALLALVRHGTDDEKAALVATRCIPSRPGRRVAPPPEATVRAYLVTYSRSDNLADLQRYFGESRIHLVDRFLQPELQTGRRKQELLEIQEFLQAPPFNVSDEARPFQVINHLVLPRMATLSADVDLTGSERDELWRMAEYVRNKWPSYVSEYKSRRNIRATEAVIAQEVASRFRVVAEVRHGSRVSVRALGAEALYIPSELLDHGGMDQALDGMPGLAVVHAVHGKRLMSAARRGGRRAGPVPEVVPFLQLLGARVGPKVEKRQVSAYAGDYVPPYEFPWVDWTALPAGFRDRTNVLDDSDSDHIRWFTSHWSAWGERRRRERGAALLGAIAADWERLGQVTRGQPAYFYWNWRELGDQVLSSWVGRLSMIPLLTAEDGSRARSTSLVLPSVPNRQAVLGDRSRLLSPRLPTEVSIGLGVRVRPSASDVLESLNDLRDAEVSDDAALSAASACYQLLGETLEAAEEANDDPEELIREWRPRFQGNSVKGLVFAPFQETEGRRWWPLSRAVRGDFTSVLGPYIASLGGRYRKASRLWEAFDVPTVLRHDLIADVIRRDLSTDSDQRRAKEYYGRICAYLHATQPTPAPKADGLPPALTTLGWEDAARVVWSADPLVLEAFGLRLPVWTPGGRDPSSLKQAAAWLGIREVSAEEVQIRATAGDLEPVELGLLSKWQEALALWPAVMRAEGFLEQEALDELIPRIGRLQPLLAGRLDIRLRLVDPSKDATEMSIQPQSYLDSDRLIGRSLDAIFSTRAAQAISALVETHRLHAANTLAMLLSHARHDPDELDRLRRRHVVADIRFEEHRYDLLDEPEEPVESIPAIDETKRRRRETRKPAVAEPPQLVPASQYVVSEISDVAVIETPPPAPPTKRRLRPPYRQPDDSPPPPPFEPKPTVRLNNMQIEARAAWFVEAYESSRGCAITRQGSNVGADFVASDGRYIEVKSFGGPAGDAFELEVPEWQAAQQPGIGENYYVYVVEHMADGLTPRLFVVPNPMAHDSVRREPTGKLRISGWSTIPRKVVEFAQVDASAPASVIERHELAD